MAKKNKPDKKNKPEKKPESESVVETPAGGLSALLLLSDGMEALGQLGEQQREQHVDSKPAEVFLRLLRAAIGSGKCHLKDNDGRYADDAAIWGWIEVEDNSGYSTWRPQGDCIGWVDGANVYLEPSASYATAQTMGAMVEVD